ncbi:hypothetical protein E6P09_09430 [Haloferax mediterranei ATCC 33500]|nr:DUF5794 domain-containing protein [Haloferax mediterranei]AFK18997.1 hypothetical protein HFX_1284 [Haloferax mediterranei ATCC 33500]AHZ21644.1 hypothetical protein BM92_02765 [Haloferax mediterranei ATCC 33500]MDX5989089.1 DUF5794 domain-containing protein [Haloferax mediterranei ATCC 33500]QCQ76633.1 hypothetical protein E6P09_09430 [Haloferax mediterranei ATCC 33500]
MALPLVDGIFPALIMAGALTTAAGGLSVTGILQTGLLIFGGSATVAVILAEMDGTRREQLTSILILGAILIPIAVAEAAVAETIETVLRFETFHRFAGLVILAVAAKTASSKVGEYLPSPSIIIGFGLVASFEPSGFEFIVNPNLTRLVSAGAAAGTGVGFAGAIALFAPRLRGNVDINLFRFGSSVALGMLALDVLGLMPTKAPVALGVLGVTALFAFDPGSADEGEADFDDLAAADGADVNGAVADGGDDVAQDDAYDGYQDADEDADLNALTDDGIAQAGDDEDASKPGYGYPGEEESRAPWL